MGWITCPARELHLGLSLYARLEACPDRGPCTTLTRLELISGMDNLSGQRVSPGFELVLGAGQPFRMIICLERGFHLGLSMYAGLGSLSE